MDAHWNADAPEPRRADIMHETDAAEAAECRRAWIVEFVLSATGALALGLLLLHALM
jgi:hypothetical protein